MAGLQRSAVSFRRQGSSGLVWDDRFLSGELNQVPGKESESNNNQDQKPEGVQGSSSSEDQKAAETIMAKAPRPINTVERSRSNGGGGRGYRTGRVSPAIEPPSPKVSACGFCSAFRKPASKKNRRTKTTPPPPPPAAGKRRSR